ncbi:hypothetical protein O998_04760 [Anaplasma phagocytophilum str. Norway variant1]|uniref:Uncharacterized protein n=1 Tax=Anaplasma phagocytophilum str. Norway variant1 TaxID=1392506 RepID=A0A7H9E0W3_ANAPH|nr:hypothetical protein [Anaplasma phagocytophilum]QLL67031.1 hypothetical protein O998_04760 [Anaplasma phagocytophilum str. Norway variant1]
MQSAFVWVIMLRGFASRNAAAVLAGLLYFGITASSSASDCKAAYQGVSDQPMREYSHLLPEEDLPKLRVCGASPQCENCFNMAPGDCRYIFPTNVMVYTEKRDNNAESVCACQVFACHLPWDPLGWARKCTTHLGCFSKPLRTSVGDLPQALVGRSSRNASVTFSPMSFLYQSYGTPGVVANIYVGDKLKRREYLFPKVQQYGSDYLRQQGCTNRKCRLLSLPKSSTIFSNTKISQGEITEGMQSFAYHAVRNSDKVCISYHEKSGLSADAIRKQEQCFHIPEVQAPRMYALNKKADTSPGVLKQCITMGYGDDHSDEDECISDSITMLKMPLHVEYSESAGGYCSLTELGSTQNKSVGGEGIVKFDGYSVLAYKYDAELQKKWYTRGVWLRIPARKFCRFAVSHVHTRGESGAVSGTPGCEYSTQKTAEQTLSVYKLFAGLQEYKVNSSSWNDFLREGMVLCPVGAQSHDKEYEVLRVVDCNKEECESKITSKLHPKASRVRVRKKPKMLRRYAEVKVGGITKRVRCDDKYSISLHNIGQKVLDESKVSGNRFKLPRYYLENSVVDNSENPCTNAEAVVYYYEGGGFIEGADSQRCGNYIEEYYAPDKKIVGCEYEYVRTDNYKPFLSGVGSVESLSLVPLSKYEQGFCIDNFSKTWFRPSYNNVKIDGVTHEKVDVSLIDKVVQHVTSGKQNIDIEALVREQPELKLPDTKDKVLTELKSIKEKIKTAKNGSSSKCCIWRTRDVTVTDKTLSYEQVRSTYRYPVPMVMQSHMQDGKNPEKENKCTLYKIEMWAGGEAASETALGRKRSGRPGQYAMLVLDFEKLKSRASTSTENSQYQGSNKPWWSAEVETINKAKHHSLILEIGEGGQPSDNSAVSKGGDTVLKLCKDDNRSNTGQSGTDAWPHVEKTITADMEVQDQDSHSCYEVARVVGGGSSVIGEPQYEIAKDLIVYYRTITGDVLANDYGGDSFLANNNAMFTKFSFEMNLPTQSVTRDDEFLKGLLENKHYVEGRSLPKRLCTWKETRSASTSQEKNKNTAFIPGMGGCWKGNENGQTTFSETPGVGENGAVMITCERWGDPNTKSTKAARSIGTNNSPGPR